MAGAPRRDRQTRSLGARLERRVARYLRKSGLKLVARNFHTRRGEIDLVMLDEDCLVFVEVRYRDHSSFADAALTVDATKQRKLLQAASMFLAANDQYVHCVCRFDVVGVDRDAGGRLHVHWLRDAFRP
ncbi:MAG: YraN family protein [Woeseiaceae bacterium]|nr:YraN family protein [Woeseiaceae bacterium]